MHNFAASLARSHAAEDLPLWEETYRAAFPDVVAIVSHREDGPHQRAGIDRSLVMANSKRILVDEKVRFRNEKTGLVYDDIALEFWADKARKQKGWVCKHLLADYIAYAIAPLGVCYLLPVLPLRRAWRKHGPAWVKSCRVVRAQNDGWITESLAVPADLVMAAISDALTVQFQRVDAPSALKPERV